MKTITLEIPDGVQLTEHDAAMIIAGKLWLEGHLSYGQAAKMTGMTKREFIESLGEYGYPFTNISAYDLGEDIKTMSEWANQKMG